MKFVYNILSHKVNSFYRAHSLLGKASTQECFSYLDRLLELEVLKS